ncbi:unnamed protein product [Dibothriocephalus latus]|uniref:Reverse transcriptase domain-containing protein n=1 Tax=Dibothriocephalus latus TaxID=60516 RepID=A0A3P6PIJ3_DIBLA|nr:unnamed protein product [Dibothriocephalus latus]
MGYQPTNYAIDRIFRKALREEDSIGLAPRCRLTEFDYADDIALSFSDLQSMVSWANEVAKSVSLSINTENPKVISFSISVQEKAPLEINGCQLEVDTSKYLGAN